jgi:hypothetical protein
MNKKAADMKVDKPDVLPDSDQWTDAELEAYEALEADVYAKFMDMTVGFRQFSREVSKYMGKLLVPPPRKRHPN